MDPYEFCDDDEFVGKFEIIDTSSNEGDETESQNIGDYLLIVEDNSFEETPNEPINIYLSTKPGTSKQLYNQQTLTKDQNHNNTLELQQGRQSNWYDFCEEPVAKKIKLAHHNDLKQDCRQKWLNVEDILDNNIFTPERYTEYSSNILDALHELEQNVRPFHYKSPQTQYRPLLVGIMKKFAQTHQLSRAAVHLGIFLMDNFMDNHTISVEKIYVFCLLCLTLGSKIEDPEIKHPKISDISNYLNDPIKLCDYLQLERLTLKYFNWQIIIPTAVTFFEFYIEAIINDFDYENIAHTGRFFSYNAMKQQVIERAVEFLDSTLNECMLMQNIKPSIVGASCLAAARESLNIGEMWTIQLERLTRYAGYELRECVDTLLENRSQAIHILSAKSNKSNESGYITDTGDADDSLQSAMF